MTARAGIVLVTKFVASGSQVFSSYIDYIDRDEAIRNQEFENFTLFQDYVGSYMDDKEKTYGLFTAERQTLTPQAKQDLKDIYQTAQQKGSLMWQTVISFDNDFLAGNGLYDAKTGDIDEEKLREYTRKSMRVMLEKEGLADAVWSASIHKNTDNIHVHIAAVQPDPSWKADVSRCRAAENGRLYQRGKFQQKNIDAAKSSFANSIIKDQIDNAKINDLKRNRILYLSRSIQLDDRVDKDIRNDFIKLADDLPEDLRLLKYGNQAMKRYRSDIDALSGKIIARYCAEDYAALTALLKEADDAYRAVYGESAQRKFSETHYEDLRQRMGNVILNQAREYKQQLRQVQLQRIQRSNLLRQEVMKMKIADAQIQKSVSGIKRNIRKDSEDMKNEAAYQRLMQEAER